MTEATWEQVKLPGFGTSEPTSLMTSPESRVLQGWALADDKLLALRNLADNWDDLGALAPTPELVDSAITFFRSLRALDDIFPPNRVLAGPMGEIVFEWQSPGVVLEVEIERPGVAEFYRKEVGRPPEMWDQSYDDKNNQDVSWGNSSAADLFQAA